MIHVKHVVDKKCDIKY